MKKRFINYDIMLKISSYTGDNLLGQNIKHFEGIHTLDVLIVLTENFIFLGQISSPNDFETREN